MKTFKNYLLVCLLILFVAACSNDSDIGLDTDQIDPNDETTLNPTDDQTDSYFVSGREAEIIANTLIYETVDATTGKVGSTTKRVKDQKIVPDKNQKSAFYIMNYQEGGFVVVSGDKREQPIMAYSNDGNFNFNKQQLPFGLLMWLEETAEAIGKIREETSTEINETQAEYFKNMYRQPCDMMRSMGLSRLPCPDGDGPCDNQYWNYGPLINASWNQWTGFNNTLPNMGCNSNGGRPPSGCVATAIGQVMRYHQHPSGYNWAAMPLGSGGSNEVSQLLEDIGDAVNMDYGCNGSGAQTSDGAGALRNTFGYSSASFSDWNHNTTKNEIRYGRPVVLAGHTDKSCFLWWCGYQNGHAWVCEGYRSTFYCEIGVTTTHYYMNWGWGGSYNGYYAYNSWNPNGYNFKYNKRMLYNIRP